MKDKKCRLLAEIGYFESRSESDKGMAAVMHVSLNRKKHPSLWPSTLHGVVSQPRQFSYRWDGSMKKGYVEKKQHIRSSVIAYKVLSGEIPDVSKGATFYFRKELSPVWSKKLTKTVVIGEHIFYC